MNILSHVDWIASVLGRVPDYVLANQSPVAEEFLASYSRIGAEPLYLSDREQNYLESLGTTVVFGDFAAIKNGKYLRHNAQNLSDKIISIAQENREKQETKAWNS